MATWSICHATTFMCLYFFSFSFLYLLWTKHFSVFLQTHQASHVKEHALLPPLCGVYERKIVMSINWCFFASASFVLLDALNLSSSLGLKWTHTKMILHTQKNSKTWWNLISNGFPSKFTTTVFDVDATFHVDGVWKS